MAINFDPYASEFKKSFAAALPKWWQELVNIFPNLTLYDDMTFSFDNTYLIWSTGSGGTVPSKNSMILAADPAKSFVEIADALRGNIFHEAVHIIQDFTGEDSDHSQISALENAVLEGVATVFEREVAEHTVPWSQVEDNFFNEWYPKVRDLEIDWSNWDTYSKWKFFDPESGERWLLYKVGVGIVDKAILNSQKSIIDFATLSAAEIISLAKLD